MFVASLNRSPVASLWACRSLQYCVYHHRI